MDAIFQDTVGHVNACEVWDGAGRIFYWTGRQEFMYMHYGFFDGKGKTPFIYESDVCYKGGKKAGQGGELKRIGQNGIGWFVKKKQTR